jgi:hypothetical protein
MAVATEVSSTYAAKPATQPTPGNAGSMDSNLQLRAPAAVTTTGNTTAIDVEGGSFAQWQVRIGAASGTPSELLSLQVSKDGGSTYLTLITLPALDVNDANQVIARPVYLPKPTGANRLLKVREAITVSGGTPSITLESYLRPLGYGSDGGMEYTT